MVVKRRLKLTLLATYHYVRKYRGRLGIHIDTQTLLAFLDKVVNRYIYHIYLQHYMSTIIFLLFFKSFFFITASSLLVFGRFGFMTYWLLAYWSNGVFGYSVFGLGAFVYSSIELLVYGLLSLNSGTSVFWPVGLVPSRDIGLSSIV